MYQQWSGKNEMQWILIALCISLCVGQLGLQTCTKEEFHCENGGVCEKKTVGDTSYALCMCFTNTSGLDCGMPNFECVHDLCQHDTQCGTDERCNCSDGYSGEDCGNKLCRNDQGDYGEDHYCRNGGVCTSTGCVCPSSTEGSHCEYLTCGDERRCHRGFCYFSQCECAIKCPFGCNTEIGVCYTSEPVESRRVILSPTFKYLLAVGSLLVVLIAVAFIYAAIKMSRERKERIQRMKENQALNRASEEKYNKWLDEEFEKHANALQNRRKSLVIPKQGTQSRASIKEEQVLKVTSLPSTFQRTDQNGPEVTDDLNTVPISPGPSRAVSTLQPEPTTEKTDDSDKPLGNPTKSKLMQFLGDGMAMASETVKKVKTRKKKHKKKN